MNHAVEAESLTSRSQAEIEDMFVECNMYRAAAKEMRRVMKRLGKKAKAKHLVVEYETAKETAARLKLGVKRAEKALDGIQAELESRNTPPHVLMAPDTPAPAALQYMLDLAPGTVPALAYAGSVLKRVDVRDQIGRDAYRHVWRYVQDARDRTEDKIEYDSASIILAMCAQRVDIAIVEDLLRRPAPRPEGGAPYGKPYGKPGKSAKSRRGRK